MKKMKVHGLFGERDTIDEATGLVKFQAGGGNGLLFGTIASTPYSSYIQSAYVTDTSVARYPLILNPIGGFVGIGTTTPYAHLEVEGTGYLQILTNTGGTATKRRFGYYGDAQKLRMLALDDVDANQGDIMCWDFDGSVGIGTDTPECLLELEEDTSRSSLTGTTKGILNLNSGMDDNNNDVTAITFNSRDDQTDKPASIIGNQLTTAGSNLVFGTSNTYVSGVSNTALFIQFDGNFMN